MQSFWQFITDFGDSSVTFGLALFLLIYLLSLERWRAAIGWLLAVTSCGIGIALLKLAFRSCVQHLASADFVSASGHTAMSATVYGGFALLLATRPIAWQRFTAGAIAIALIAAIAISRVILGAHHRAEVIAGLLVGIAAILLFRQVQRHDRRPLPVMGLLAGAVVLTLLMHGAHWPIEEYLMQLAAAIRRNVPACS